MLYAWERCFWWAIYFSVRYNHRDRLDLPCYPFLVYKISQVTARWAGPHILLLQNHKGATDGKNILKQSSTIPHPRNNEIDVSHSTSWKNKYAPAGPCDNCQRVPCKSSLCPLSIDCLPTLACKSLIISSSSLRTSPGGHGKP